jgi:hypothetical protein
MCQQRSFAGGSTSMNPLSPASITRVLSAIVFGLSAMSLVANLSLAVPIDGYWMNEIRDSLVRLFDINGEGNIPSWYSSSALLACAFLLALIAAQKKRTQDRFLSHWVGLAIIFVYLSMDESAAIHEMAIKPVRAALDTDGFLRFAWIIPGSVAVLLFVLIYARFLASLPSRLRAQFLIAGALYVGGAIGMEAISGYYATVEGRDGLMYMLVTAAEEAAEMAGVVVMIHALLSHSATARPSRLWHSPLDAMSPEE